MEGDLSIAISGTPGTGKTSLAGVFVKERINVVSVEELAEAFGYLGNLDSKDGTKEVDIHRLSNEWQHDNPGIIVVEGHLSHFLDVDAIVILRCNPSVLRKRLELRKYSEQKVTANVEWELISGVWSELLEFEIEAPILEIDTTELATEQVYDKVVSWLNGELVQEDLFEQSNKAIDWMDN